MSTDSSSALPPVAPDWPEDHVNPAVITSATTSGTTQATSSSSTKVTPVGELVQHESAASHKRTREDTEAESDGEVDAEPGDNDAEEESGDPDGFDSVEEELEEGEDSMDEAEYQRHCAQHTITVNRGQRRRRHNIQGCRSVNHFQKLNLINEGTYGRVWRAKQTLSNGKVKINALKQVKMEREKEGFPMTALREIYVLMTLKHPNIVNVHEVVVGSRADSIFLVMEYVEHDLKYLMDMMKAKFSQSEVKCLLMQLLSACKYMHDNWIIHRDLKTSNLLYNNNGNLKVCDFGLARLYGEPVKKMTPFVVTLWYRSPEVLLGEDSYTPVVDMWSVGCIFAELLQKEALFQGKNEFEVLIKIYTQLGSPSESNWPGYEQLPHAKKYKFTPMTSCLREKFPASSMYSDKPSLTENGYDLLSRLLALDPKKRLSAADSLNHAYFKEIPAPQDTSMMPTFRPTNEEPRKKQKKGAEDPNRETKKALGIA